MADRFLGLDVGGTQVKAGTVEGAELPAPDPAVLAARTRTIETAIEAGADRFFDRLADFVRGEAPDARIALGFPGVFERSSGRLVRSANLRVAEGLDLAGELGRRLDRPPEEIAVGNDANLAIYGEQWLGAGRGVRDLVMLTLGTGIGGGIVLGGELFTGATGMGAEIGHVVLRGLEAGESGEEGLRCGCGAYGCFERLGSATAALRRARAAGLAGSLEEIAGRARAGGAAEGAVFHAVGRDVGLGLLSVAALVDVSTFVIGGGFGATLDLLRPGILEAYGERDYGGGPPRLLPAELGAAAGWIGAARLAAEREGHRL